MKLVRFEKGGVVRLGVLTLAENGVMPMSAVLPKTQDMTMTDFIQAVDEDDLPRLAKAIEDGSGFPVIPLSELTLLAPIDHPAHDILCVGVNYKSHVAEAEKGLHTPKESGASDRAAGGFFSRRANRAEQEPAVEEPRASIYFLKRAVRVLGSGEAIEGRFDLDPELDYESELAVILGKGGKDIPPERAEDYIFGYSVFNDISSRKIQRMHQQFFLGKSLDTYTAMGPCIVTKDAVPFPPELEIRCTVNGEVRLQSNTSEFLNGVPGIISDLSQGMTLQPGDIIATGTPGGVAMGMDEPKWLTAGDTVTCEIESIGALTNLVK